MIFQPGVDFTNILGVALTLAGVNFINILRAHFCMKVLLAAFSS